MCVPDFELICEIMLVAEGFQEARVLARKFITLYTLCKELLSKQDHYDWGLRAIKSVLVVAGSLKVNDKILTSFFVPYVVLEQAKPKWNSSSNFHCTVSEFAYTSLLFHLQVFKLFSTIKTAFAVMN
jgi:hypothetical protein